VKKKINWEYFLSPCDTVPFAVPKMAKMRRETSICEYDPAIDPELKKRKIRYKFACIVYPTILDE